MLITLTCYICPSVSGLSSIPGRDTSDYPSPNISVGPPIHPSPHLLPYLYPHSLYPPGASTHPLLNPSAASLSGLFSTHPSSLLFNAQLQALAASAAISNQQSAAFFAYQHHQQSLKHQHANLSLNRYSPYNLSNHLLSSSLSAFEQVTPHNNNNTSNKIRELNSKSPPSRTRTPSPRTSSPHSNNNVHSPRNSPSPVSIRSSKHSPSATSVNELKSIEKMVNGLDVQKLNHERTDKS